MLVDLLNYRNWAERFKSIEPANVPILYEVKDTSRALLCPKCAKIMLKFRIAGSTTNKVDLCSNCDEAWLDDGEWELLASLKIQSRLHEIFTEPWQRNIRIEQANEALAKRFKDLLGNEEYTKLKDLKEWINKHPNRNEIVRYIMMDEP